MPRPASRTVSAASSAASTSRPGLFSPEAVSAAPSRVSRTSYFEDYVSLEQVVEGVAAGRYIIGTLKASSAASKIASVAVPFCHPKMAEFLTKNQAGSNDVAIIGHSDRNRAFHGDEVAVEVHPPSKWCTARTLAADKEQTWSFYSEDAGASVLAEQARQHSAAAAAAGASDRPVLQSLRATGRVVAIVKATHPTVFSGVLRSFRSQAEPPLPDDTIIRFVPHSSALPGMDLLRPGPETPFATLDYTHVYSAQIVDWPKYSTTPRVELQADIGELSNINVASAQLLEDGGFVDVEFPPEILAEMPTLPWTPPEIGHDGAIRPADELTALLPGAVPRRDLRKAPIFTIDPAGARDLDDAVSVELVSGNPTSPEALFKFGVHIADVTAFVAPQSHTDLRAQAQTTSVYLIEKVVPMLPRVLCDDLCSLVPFVPRYAFSVEWYMHGDGTMAANRPVEYFRSIISTAARLDYQTAQDIIDGKLDGVTDATDQLGNYKCVPGMAPAVVFGTKTLFRVSQVLRRMRLGLGALIIPSSELKFQLDESRTIPVKVGLYPMLGSNSLIEEFMLMANQLVTRRVLLTFPSLAPVRHHPAPNDLTSFASFCASAGMPIEANSPNQLSASFERAMKANKQLCHVLAAQFVCSSLAAAEYSFAGALGEREAWVHWGVGVPLYCHFTSPIRRYADDILHRLLQAALDVAAKEAECLPTVPGTTPLDPEVAALRSHEVSWPTRCPFYVPRTQISKFPPVPLSQVPNGSVVAAAATRYMQRKAETAALASLAEPENESLRQSGAQMKLDQLVKKMSKELVSLSLAGDDRAVEDLLGRAGVRIPGAVEPDAASAPGHAEEQPVDEEDVLALLDRIEEEVMVALGVSSPQQILGMLTTCNERDKAHKEVGRQSDALWFWVYLDKLQREAVAAEAAVAPELIDADVEAQLEASESGPRPLEETRFSFSGPSLVTTDAFCVGFSDRGVNLFAPDFAMTFELGWAVVNASRLQIPRPHPEGKKRASYPVDIWNWDIVHPRRDISLGAPPPTGLVVRDPLAGTDDDLQGEDNGVLFSGRLVQKLKDSSIASRVHLGPATRVRVCLRAGVNRKTGKPEIVTTCLPLDQQPDPAFRFAPPSTQLLEVVPVPQEQGQGPVPEESAYSDDAEV
jgi:exoribonuclease R